MTILTKSGERIIAATICLALAAALAGLYFFPWAELTITADGPIEEMTRGQLNQSGLGQEVHTIGTASGWELTTADVTMIAPEAGMRHNVDESLFVARPWLIAGLLVPAVALLAAGWVLVSHRHARKMGLLVALAAAGGLLLVRAAMRVDLVDDLLAPLADKTDAASKVYEVITRSVMHTTEGTSLWASLVLYAMLAFFGLALCVTGRTPRAK